MEEIELPYELDYNTVPRNSKTFELDWEKLNYNGYYKSYAFYASKFSGDFSSIPGFEQVIEEMVKNSKYPLEGWIERQEFSNDKVEEIDEVKLSGSDTDISEFKDSKQVSQ